MNTEERAAIEAFQAAWHAADAEGRAGHRTEAGLAAAAPILRATVQAERDRHGPCVCDTGPNTDGPDEFCPRHGRTYTNALDLMDRIVKDAREERDEARATVERAKRLVRQYDDADTLADRRRAIGSLRAALDGADQRPRRQRPYSPDDHVDADLGRQSRDEEDLLDGTDDEPLEEHPWDMQR